MSSKKFRANQLFDGYQLLNDQWVLITSETGFIEGIVPVAEAGENVQHFTGILSPGFVNCHCHLELSHMKGFIGEGTGLPEFVYKVVTERHLPDEEILQAIERAEEEMLRDGIVAVGDICNNILTIRQKKKKKIQYYNFVETSGFNPQLAEQRFDRSLAFFREYALISPTSIVPHAPYSVADELWEMIVDFPANHLMTIHNQETIAENEWFIQKKRKFCRLLWENEY